MKFFARMMYAGGTNEKAIFNVPCDGFFSNLTVKIVSSANLSHIWSFGDINQDNFFLQVTSGTPSFSRGNSRTFWSGAGILDYPATTEDLHCTVWNRSDPLHCKRARDVAFSIDSSVSATTVIVIEGEYVPYHKSEFKYVINFDDSEATMTWATHNLLIPQTLGSAYIEIKGAYTDTAASEAVLWVRLATQENPNHVTTFTTDEFGTVGNALSNDEASAVGNMHPIYLSIPAGELTQFIDTALIPDKQFIRSGNLIQFTLRDTGGTETPGAGQIHLTLTIVGMSMQSNRRALKANYYSGQGVVNANLVGGLYN